MKEVKQWRCPDLDVAELKARREGILTQIGARLREGATGLSMTAELSQMTDGMLHWLRDALKEAGVPDPPMAVFATGSYGQQLLCPRSDLDLLVVYNEGQTPESLAVWCGAFQTALQDAGMKVGMAHRTPAQCIDLVREDESIAAATLSARLLWGGREVEAPWPMETLPTRTEEILRAGDGGVGFARSLRQGRHAGHARYGRTVYLLEPDIKHGRGGLRDFQAMIWAASVLHGARDIESAAVVAGARPEEAMALRSAVEALFKVRVALHTEGGRFGNDRLTFERQERLAGLFGFEATERGGPLPVESFMRAFYGAAQLVARLCLQWQDLWLLPVSDEDPVYIERGLCVRQGRVDLIRRTDTLARREPVPNTEQSLFFKGPRAVSGPDLDSLSEEAKDLLRTNPVEVHEVALDLGLRLHPVADAHLARAALVLDNVGPDWGVSLRRVVCAQEGAGALTRGLFRSGLLPRALPEFEPVVGLGTHDVYHVLTVDAHLIQALEGGRAMLRGDWRADKPGGRFFSDIAQKMPAHRRDIFLLSCLLHDVGKGRGGDHSKIGAELAREIGPRLRLTARQTAHLEFLILEHLLMPKVSQRRDLQDPKVIEDVARRVRTLGALDDLTLLAAVDMDAVGPQNLTHWKAGLLIELYGGVRRVLEGGIEDLDHDLARGEVRRRLEGLLGDGVDRAALDVFVREAPLSALRRTAPEALARQFDVVRAGGEVGVGFHMAEGGSATEVIVCTADRPALLATIAGVISACGLNILSAQINPGPGGKALDVFAVQTARGKAAITASSRASLIRSLEGALAGELDVAELIGKRRRSGLGPRAAPEVPTQVEVDHTASSRYTIIEVKARDGVGLLWTIARALFDAGCAVHIAKIVTEGERVIDTFYLEARATGQKLSHDEAARVCECLLAALE